MTENEAIDIIHDKIETCEFYFAENDRYPKWCEYEFLESLGAAISALKEIQQYREIETVEEIKKAVKEEDILKFYYCESEDDYYIGKREENFYYARYGETGFEWFMSRHLPWGERVVAPKTLWKEHTYPTEPKEISFFEWLQGFLKKYCGGTVEECREAVEKQKPKKPEIYTDTVQTMNGSFQRDVFECPVCGDYVCNVEDEIPNYCCSCGQKLEESEGE